MAIARRFAIDVGLFAIALLVLWFVCVASFKPHEAIVGIAASGLSIAFVSFVIRIEKLPFDPTLRQLLECWRLPGYVLNDAVDIVLVFFRDLSRHRAPSLFRSASFDTGAGTDGRATARRVLAITFATISPNFLIVGIDCKRRQMLFHQLKRSGVPRMTQNLGARP